MDWWDVSDLSCSASALLSMSCWSGVMESLASRRSEFEEVMRAAVSHLSPSVEVMIRSEPSGDACCEPSLKAQNQRFLK